MCGLRLTLQRCARGLELSVVFPPQVIGGQFPRLVLSYTASLCVSKSLFVKDRNKDASLSRLSNVRALTLARGNFDYTFSGIEPSLDFVRELVVTGSKENFNVHVPIGAQICNARNFKWILTSTNRQHIQVPISKPTNTLRLYIRYTIISFAGCGNEAGGHLRRVALLADWRLAQEKS